MPAATRKYLALLLCFYSLAGCRKHDLPDGCTDAESLYRFSSFPIGTAINWDLLLNDSLYHGIAVKQFNSFTGENIFKADQVHPEQNNFDWNRTDDFADFCLQHNKRLHGHTLIWHEQLPQWILKYDGSRPAWEQLMKTHIQTVMRRYKGAAAAWDVVNEAFNEDGTLRNTIWRQKIGDGYIEKAFSYAHEADPDALLFYNDYSLEMNPAKRKAVLGYFNSLRARGVRIDGIGLQMHISIYYPDISQIADALRDVAQNKYRVHISELDISMNPFGKDMELTSDLLNRQAEILAAIARLYKEIPASTQYGITFWGISDSDSWIRNYFDREDYPLLYDDNYLPKPAYCSLKENL